MSTVRNVLLKLKGLRAYSSRRFKTQLPGPLSVQIQTINRCNGSCRMCPYSTLHKLEPPAIMDEMLYSKILEDLYRAGTVRRFILTLQNEPLLDPGLVRRVVRAREILGNSVDIGLVTNGTLLNEKLYDDLVCTGLNIIVVSIDAFYEDTYRAVRPELDFSEVVANVHMLLQRNHNTRVAVKFVRQKANAREEKQFVQYWKSHRAGIFTSSLVNRAGLLAGFEHMRGSSIGVRTRCIKAVRDRFFPSCLIPFTTLNVLCDGRVILCCDDWGPIDTVGDLSSQPLPDVWNGAVINSYRNLLYNNKAGESFVCKDCSVTRRHRRGVDGYGVSPFT